MQTQHSHSLMEIHWHKKGLQQ